MVRTPVLCWTCMTTLNCEIGKSCWSLSQMYHMSLLAEHATGNVGKNAGYTWDWGDSRKGSWQPDDEPTSINRYVIDFGAMEQTNIDNNRK